jgi:hypothetical protein
MFAELTGSGLDSLDPDSSEYPINIIVVNPNKGRYYSPPCPLCL